MLKAKLVNDLVAMNALRGDWEKLHAGTGRGIFQSFDWVRSWAGIVDGVQGRSLQIVDIEGDGYRCILPLMTHRRFGVRRLRWLGVEVTDHCDVIASERSASGEIAAFIRGSLPPADLIELRQLLPGSVVGSLFPQALQPGRIDESCPAIAVAGFDFPKDILYAERRTQSTGTLVYEVADSDNVRQDIVAFVISQKRKWLSRQRRTSWEFDQLTAPFLRTLPKWNCPTGSSPYFSRLVLDGKTIAAQIGFIEGNRMLYYLPAFDSAFRRHSPGHLVILNMVRDAARLGLETVDLLRGQETYKHKWANSTQNLEAVEWSSSLRGRSFAWASKAKRRLIQS